MGLSLAFRTQDFRALRGRHCNRIKGCFKSDSNFRRVRETSVLESRLAPFAPLWNSHRIGRNRIYARRGMLLDEEVQARGIRL
jgi:hypothetical protein